MDEEKIRQDATEAAEAAEKAAADAAEKIEDAAKEAGDAAKAFIKEETEDKSVKEDAASGEDAGEKDKDPEDQEKEVVALKDVDTEWEAEKICRWAAARASVIVVAPVLGTMGLIANEVYMITRLADLRSVKLSEGAALGLLGSLGATFVGQSVFTLLPIPAIQIPLAVSITYGVGKAANAWLKAGRPEDVASFREVFEKARKEGMENTDAFTHMDCKDEPLGDESKKFDIKNLRENVKNVKGEEVFGRVKDTADKAESTISKKIKDLNDRIVNPIKNKGGRWISAQNWEQLSKGELVIPYGEIKNYLVKALAGSEFALLDASYLPPDYLRLSLQHSTYGTIELKLSVLDFYVDKSEGTAHLKVEGFDICNNDFASLVISTIGDKLILAIIDLAFDKITIEDKGITTTFEDGVIGVDFTRAMLDSSVGKTRFLEKSVLDVLHLVDLSVEEKGLKIKASVSL